MHTRKSRETLTAEKFNEFIQDLEKLRMVACAHHCCDQNGRFLYWSTCSYPIEYTVSKEQKYEAAKLYTEQRAAFKEANKNKLVITMMGHPGEEYGDLKSPRIRTYFKDKNGDRSLVELGFLYNKQSCAYMVTHSDNIELEKSPAYKNGEYRNHGLKENDKYFDLTQAKLLKLINKTFGCTFKEIVFDQHFGLCDELYCVSPSKK